MSTWLIVVLVVGSWVVLLLATSWITGVLGSLVGGHPSSLDRMKQSLDAIVKQLRKRNLARDRDVGQRAYPEEDALLLYSWEVDPTTVAEVVYETLEAGQTVQEVIGALNSESDSDGLVWEPWKLELVTQYEDEEMDGFRRLVIAGRRVEVPGAQPAHAALDTTTT
jgi:hypothetical protein